MMEETSKRIISMLTSLRLICVSFGESFKFGTILYDGVQVISTHLYKLIVNIIIIQSRAQHITQISVTKKSVKWRQRTRMIFFL